MLTPQDETALSQMIRDADGPLRIAGGGTRWTGGTGTMLRTGAMSGITLYDPGALTLVARAGTPVDEIAQTLAAENQRLAFEPMDHRAITGSDGTPTIGGVVAANVSGPRRIAVGACRDFLLGLRFVDGLGQIIKNGGRVMKNVTGYDLAKLLCGSHGTLGVITEVSLKVLPDVAATGVLYFDGLGDADAVALMSAALGAPYDVTGAAHLRGADGPVTMIRVEGFAASVSYRAEALQSHLAQFGTPRVTQTDGTDPAWQAVRDVTALAGQDGDLWRISVKPTDAAALVARCDTRGVQYDWGGGLIWALTDPGHDLRAQMQDTPGHATRVRGDGPLPRFHPEPAPLAAISAGLRQRFDPRGILNPGAMG